MPLKIEKVAEYKHTIVGFECDKCSTVVTDDDFVEMQERFDYTHVGGYGSVIGDGVEFHIVLCQQCMYDTFKDFIHSGEANES